jgi:hypothetical protein
MNQSEFELIARVLKRNRAGYVGTSIEREAWEVTQTLVYEFMRSLSEYKSFDSDKFLAAFERGSE